MQKRILSISFIIYFLSIYTSNANLFTDPDVPNGEIGVYKIIANNSSKYFNSKDNTTLNNNLNLNNLVMSVQRFNNRGDKFYNFSIKKDFELFAYEETTIIKGGEYLIPMNLHTIVKDSYGRVRRENKACFDFYGNERRPEDSEKADILPKNFVPMSSLQFILRGMPFKEDNRVDFYVWLSDAAIFKAYAVIEKEEIVSVPAGDFDSYYVVMTADLNEYVDLPDFLKKVVIFFGPNYIPKYKFWFSKDEPHTFIKFEGIYGLPGSSDVKIELVKIENNNKQVTKIGE